jgi:prevent-host-death family protein
MNVGVRELKQHLSDYLDRAAAGEHVVVTDRGIPKVLIVPIPGEGQLERGISEGWIRPAARSGGLVPFARVSSPARVLDLLDDDRDG